MLYHIDNTTEMPSDRFGTGWQQQFTDPVDPADRAYINFWIHKWVEIIYWRRREIYWPYEKYYRYTNESKFWEWLDNLYHKSETDFNLYRKENPKGRNLIIKIWMKYYKCEETSVSSESEVDVVRYSWLLMWVFIWLTLWFIGASILFYVI